MSNLLMQIKGIEGDVTTEGFVGWIALKSATKRNTRSITGKVGKMSDREGGAPDFKEIEIIKTFDSASNQLFEKSCIAKAIPLVEINVCSTDSTPVVYCKMKLSDVLISEHVLHMNENTRPVESFSINYSKIEMTHIKFDKNKKAQSPDVVGYDLATAQMV